MTIKKKCKKHIHAVTDFFSFQPAFILSMSEMSRYYLNQSMKYCQILIKELVYMLCNTIDS